MDTRILEGPMIIKGILDPEDAKDAVQFGADGIVVSNHGGRQLDGVPFDGARVTRHRCRRKGQIKISQIPAFALVWMWCAYARTGSGLCHAGSRCLCALAAGEVGVKHLLELIEKEIRVCHGTHGRSAPLRK